MEQDEGDRLNQQVEEVFRVLDAVIMYNSRTYFEENSGPDHRPFIPDYGYDISHLNIQTILKTHIDDNMECAICLESFRLRQIVFKLDCSHMFHRNCARVWLIPNGTCPMCGSHI